jgi:hypothetical protein
MRSIAGIILLTGLTPTVVSCTALNTDTVTRDGVPYYLPHTLLTLTFDPGAQGAPPAITAQPNDVADPLQRYIAYYAPNAFAQDRLCVSRSTTTGLLSRVWFSAQDQTEQVLLNVVQVAANFAAPAAPAASLRARSKPSAPVTMTIDPSDPTQLSAFNRKLGPYRIALPDMLVPAAPFLCPQNSICFGTRISVPIQLYRDRELVDQRTVTMVDPNHYGSIDISRAFMTARITKIDFDNGVMTNLRVSKDSEALAASEFPLKAIERILAVPGNGFALAVGTFEQKQAYLNNRKQLQDALSGSGQTAGQASSSDLKLIDADSCLDQKQQQSASANQSPGGNSAIANQLPGGSGVSGPPPRLSK